VNLRLGASEWLMTFSLFIYFDAPVYDEGNAIVICMTASHVDIKKIENLTKSVKMNLIESLKVKP
jgi:hypothetical protein